MTPFYTAQLKRLHANSPEVADMTQAAFIRAARLTQRALGIIDTPELEGKDRHEGLEGVVDQVAGALETISDFAAEQRKLGFLPTHEDGDELLLDKAVVTITTYIAITHRVLQKTPAAQVAAAAKNVELSSMLPKQYVADVAVETVGAAND